MTDRSTAASGLRPIEIAAFVGLVLACRWIAVPCCPTYDDAFITYRYALNLAHGQGFVFNPGADWEPVLGTTTVLYTGLLAACVRLGAEIVTASLALNLVCDAGIAVLLARLFGARRLTAMTVLLAFAAFPPLVRISVGGMESPLFALSALGACMALASGRPALAGACAAATCLTRPEGVLLAGVLFLSRLREPRALVRYCVPLLVIGALAIGVLSALFGSPVPQSVLAKSTMHAQDRSLESWMRWKTIVKQSLAPSLALLPVVPLVLVGWIATIRRTTPVRWFGLFAAAIPASYLVARPHTWGWYYFVTHIGWIVGLAVGIELVRPRVGWIQRIASRLEGSRVLPWSAIVGVLLAATFVAHSRPSPVVARVYEPLMRWADETTRREPGARVLASDIGAVAFRWRGHVLDSEGLTWPAALRHRYPARMIAAESPEYLLVVAERPRLQHVREDVEVRARYEPILRFSASGETDLEPALETVSVEWSQDYIVYRRKSR